MKHAPTHPRTYQLSEDHIARIDALATDLECYPSTLVNMLLGRALAEVEAGRWPLGREPAAYRAVWRDGASPPARGDGG